MKSHLPLLLSLLIAIGAHAAEPKEWRSLPLYENQTVKAVLWAFHPEHGFVTLKRTDFPDADPIMVKLDKLSPAEQAVVKATNAAELPAKTGFPQDPDLLGFKLLMTPGEVLAHLNKLAFKVEDNHPQPDFAQRATVLTAAAQGRPKPTLPKTGRIVGSLTGKKEEEGKRIEFRFEFVEDISLNPSVEKCHHIHYAEYAKPGVDSAALKRELVATVIGKFGPPLNDRGGAFYADNENDGRTNQVLDAPNLRFLNCRNIGDITLRDVGYYRRTLALQYKQMKDIREAAQKPVPKGKL